jgi:hypothetical protein
MKNKLQTIANYAKENGITQYMVKSLIAKGQLKIKLIDGVTFIRVGK